MVTWLIVLIIVLSVIVGIPVYGLVGSKLTRYPWAMFRVAWALWRKFSSELKREYCDGLDDWDMYFPFYFKVFWPVVLIFSVIATVVLCLGYLWWRFFAICWKK